jgi:hypothetical protein
MSVSQSEYEASKGSPFAGISDQDRERLEAWLVDFDQGWDKNRLAAWVRKLPPSDDRLAQRRDVLASRDETASAKNTQTRFRRLQERGEST